MAGRLAYFEIPAGDPERARSFYEGVFAWRFGEPGPERDYVMFDPGGGPDGGLFGSAADARGVVVYFEVESIDAAIARVAELGGTAQPKQAVPFTGWYARCVDTEGNAFSLFERDPSVSEI